MTKGKAIAFKIDIEDLESEVNNALGRASSSNTADFENDEEKFIGYIARSIHNCAINVRRRNIEHGSKVFSSDNDELRLHSESRQRVYQKDTEQAELLEKIMSWAKAEFATDKYPRNYKVIFQSYFVEEMKYEEIAMLTTIPLGTVKTQIRCIRLLIKEKFGKQYAAALGDNES